MIIDEIGRKSEADAARTAASRGVRLIATAHGSFRSLLGNPDTNGLLGGVSNVVLGDEYAKSKMEDGSQSNFRESRAERLSNPVFDVAVELGVGANAECTVIMNTAEAVDRILAGKRYKVQRRNWDGISSSILLVLQLDRE
ncbi:AAA [Seminavis robusta]|uniref:AAA n=1 Tax=Seminavis robusta TaxID=568900 RepID=A0A9N8HQG6_9STRA|nr:AAA [Seminavis robusta]|eukprot:Sro982_g227700.1 AAA (141) ;mRNA; f:23332-23754